MSEESGPFAVWYSRDRESIRLVFEVDEMTIRDAVFLRHQLDNAIRDYDKAAGR